MAGELVVLIPFRDRWPLTERCLRSLERQAIPGISAKIVLIDNGSVEAETAVGIQAAVDNGTRTGKTSWKVTSIRLNESFNYSRLNNEAVQRLAGDARWLLFLNNDVELQEANALNMMLAFAERCPNLGALGTSLVYPDGSVQHLFTAPGIKIVAAHPLKGRRLPADAAWFLAPRPVAAVTGAVMLVAKKNFVAAGGFDEQLPTVGQDVDLCLKLQRLGLVNWVLPHVQAVHLEGASRGGAIDKQQVARLYEYWGEFLIKNPYYSSRFSRWSEAPIYSVLEPKYPWRAVLP